MRKYVFIFIILFANLFSDTFEINMAAYKEGTHAYYHDLIVESMKEIGHTVKINPIYDVPQSRVTAMLTEGKITLQWMVENPDLDTKFVPVNVGLTKGLIGHRILFIPKGAQKDYDNVKTLDDFRNLNKVGGFGKNFVLPWFDAKVWSANNLKYIEESGDWTILYKKVAAKNRGVDYFSRGANEIVIEAKNPEIQKLDLEIEKNLVLIYKRDFKFYLSPKYKNLKDVLEKALKNAEEKGIIDRLLEKHYPEIYSPNGLNLNNRTKIYLKMP